ncbi:TrmH family RNA methyltransferase [Changchengzhania lutea]|uniref:TrmH family RNA methyltransferase n=1 Tax=Changchengzhania lutea TaxID=2049305 RepID=UPI00115C5B97|nr:TrmH family RNA methyltransferase [Changchengzhania lutea]
MQLTHYNTNFKSKKFPIVLVCDNITNAPNLGSLFRTADAFGIERLILCGEHISVGKKLRKTSRSTEKVVDYEICKSAIALVKDLKNKNYQIISLEITTNSQSLATFQFNTSTPIALILGDENFGVSEDILKLSDAVLHIPMYGQNSSMNVVQATTLALYEIIKQLKPL